MAVQADADQRAAGHQRERPGRRADRQPRADVAERAGAGHDLELAAAELRRRASRSTPGRRRPPAVASCSGASARRDRAWRRGRCRRSRTSRSATITSGGVPVGGRWNVVAPPTQQASPRSNAISATPCFASANEVARAWPKPASASTAVAPAVVGAEDAGAGRDQHVVALQRHHQRQERAQPLVGRMDPARAAVDGEREARIGHRPVASGRCRRRGEPGPIAEHAMRQLQPRAAGVAGAEGAERAERRVDGAVGGGAQARRRPGGARGSRGRSSRCGRSRSGAGGACRHGR